MEEPNAQQMANRVAATTGGQISEQATQPSQGLNTDTLMKQLSDKLFQTSDMISSSQSGLQDMISRTISGVKESQAASAKRIESSFSREQDYAYEAGKNNLTAANEARRGFATNTAAIRLLNEQTDKQIKDLEQRKQELLLANDAQAAQQITGLQVQAYQFKQEAQQNYFNNILGLGQFAVQTEQVKQNIINQTRGLDLQEKQLALQEQKFEFDQISSTKDRLLKQQELDLRKRQIDAELGTFDNTNFKNIQDQSQVQGILDSIRTQVYQKSVNQNLTQQETEALYAEEALRLAATYSGIITSDPVTYFMEQFGLNPTEQQVAQEEQNQDEVFDIFSLAGATAKGAGKLMTGVGNFFGAERIADFFDKTRIR